MACRLPTGPQTAACAALVLMTVCASGAPAQPPATELAFVPGPARELPWAGNVVGLTMAAAHTTTRILGPAVPPVARVQGLYRRHLLVKAAHHREIAAVLQALRSAPRPRGRVEEIWDVDPIGVL